MTSNDKFAHIAALRPVKSPRRVTSDLPLEAERLGELLGAETQRNRYGEHLVARRWYAEPEACEARPEALRLLAADVSEEAADPSRWLFLDTETTGLAGGTGTYAFLVGLAWWDAGGLQVEQFFMRDHSEEYSLLVALAERLAERRVLVTFNGKTFDWPLLETRYRMTRRIPLPKTDAHLDLLHPARQLWRLSLPSLRLTEIERHILGWDRGPDLWSAMIPQIYFDYLRGGSAAPLADVLRHNAMDLRGLAALAAKLLALVDSACDLSRRGGAGPAQESGDPNLARSCSARTVAPTNPGCHSESASADEESAPPDPLELYGLSRLLRRRGEPARARRLYERALGAGLRGAAARAARRELAQLAKRDRDFPRATALWQELIGGRGFSPDSATPHTSRRASAPEVTSSLGAEASTLENRPLSELKLRPPRERIALGGDSLDAFEQLAIYYEHHAGEPARAAELTREALRELRRALREGGLDPARFARWKARLERRLARLERRASAKQLRIGRDVTRGTDIELNIESNIHRRAL